MKRARDHIRARKHWNRISELNWIDRVWEEAHEMNEWVLIQRDNQRAGEAYMKWRESLTNVAMKAYAEKLEQCAATSKSGS